MSSDIGKRRCHASPRKDPRDLQKIWCDGDSHLSGRVPHNRGAVVGTITNALKKLGKNLGDGLETLGAKAASALPGLIGAIVSFLFKAAGSVIGFLAEHTWILILAVVVFLFEKLHKKGR